MQQSSTDRLLNSMIAGSLQTTGRATQTCGRSGTDGNREVDSLKILVLAGGTSAEREVSLDSGLCVSAALRARGHHVDLCDPAETPVHTLNVKRWDIVFPVVHGTGGEDGVLQQELLNAGFCYVGSSPECSALTFHKIRTNTLLKQHGIRVPDSLTVTQSEINEARLRQLCEFADFENPQGGVVTKPPCQGSSIGVSIVLQKSQLDNALQLAFHYDQECLVERFIAGRELTVPVIDGQAFPSIEVQAAGEWYDYHSKYTDDRTKYLVNPTDLPLDLQRTAVAACELCGVTGIARVDFRVDEAGQAWLLEINTSPGLTSHSLVPKSAAAVGLDLGQLCEAVIRHRLQSKTRDGSNRRCR